MEKKKIIFFTVTGIFVLLCGTFLGVAYESRNYKDLNETSEMDKLDKLKNILKASGYFDNSKYEYDLENDKITIDNKYDISIKTGYYSMNIKDSKDESVYCNIVDAINISFGGKAGESIETCRLTLEGAIDLGGISVEFFDTYKVLSVSNGEKPTLYNISNSHSEDELISIDEINYDIKIDDYMFTTMSTKYIEQTKVYSICGNIFSYKKSQDDFLFKIYDEKKEEISDVTYSFSKDSNKYKPFCVEFSENGEFARFYSVSLE
mgnify:CR=1 FL=1